jgi:trypsin
MIDTALPELLQNNPIPGFCEPTIAVVTKQDCDRLHSSCSYKEGSTTMRGVDTIIFFLLGVIATLMLPVSSALGLQSHLRQEVETQAQTSSDSMGTLLDFSLTDKVIDLPTTPKILGGNTTERGQYPYFATTSNSVCGATLIHSDILLTAAHCQKQFATTGVVYIGAHQTDTFTQTAVRRTIIRQYLHPDNDLTPFKSDLMLFQLNAPVNNVSVITLSSDPALPRLNSTLTVIGFGVTSTKSFVHADSLLAVDVFAIDDELCVRQYEEITTIYPQTMLCAGHPLPDRDSCGGDSGGPLLDTTTGEQVGIVSFGKGCGEVDFPGVYTRVSTYTSWILDRICELSAVPPMNCPAPMIEPNSNTNSVSEKLHKVILEIQYDGRSAESFWRLDDDLSGKTVAFQPAIPNRGEFFRQEILLPTGRYRLIMTDTSGEGICCYWGLGSVTISAEIKKDKAVARDETVAVEARMNNPDDNVEILGQSDGKFGFHLSLPFVVGGPILDDKAENSGTGNTQVHLVVILVGVALSVTVLL